MDVANQALLGESRATIFSLRHQVRDLLQQVSDLKAERKLIEETLENERATCLYWFEETQRLRRGERSRATAWVGRTTSTPALDAQIAELSAYQRES